MDDIVDTLRYDAKTLRAVASDLERAAELIETLRANDARNLAPTDFPAPTPASKGGG